MKKVIKFYYICNMKKLQFNTLIITIAIVLTTSFQWILYGQDNQDDVAIAQKAEEYIKKIQKDWKIPGLSVSISKGGKVVYAKGFGVKELTNNMFNDQKTGLMKILCSRSVLFQNHSRQQ